MVSKMNTQDFLNTLRQLDKRSSQWFMRHFYVLFFEVILVGVICFFVVTTLNVFYTASDVPSRSTVEKLLVNQNHISLLILFLLLLNSFWMLFLFSGFLRVRNILKNIDFNLSRRGNDRRDRDDDN
jgi:hypothetical protein